MYDNGLNVFYTFCFDSNIHHPGLGHRELWNMNMNSLAEKSANGFGIYVPYGGTVDLCMTSIMCQLSP